MSTLSSFSCHFSTLSRLNSPLTKSRLLVEYNNGRCHSLALICCSITAPRNKTETRQASKLAIRKDTKRKTATHLAVEGPKGLRIGLYYCFSPRGISSQVHVILSILTIALNLTPTQVCRSLLKAHLCPHHLLNPLHGILLFSTIPVQAHALSPHPITNTSTFSFEDFPWCT